MIAPRLRASRVSRIARPGPAKTTPAFFGEVAALVETPWAGAAIPDFVHLATRDKRPENFEAFVTFALALGKLASRAPEEPYRDFDSTMTELFVSRGPRGRLQHHAPARRLPPGQHERRHFPALSASPTAHTSLATCDVTVRGPGGSVARWTWEEFKALPHETVTTDIHCFTKWSKLDTVWEGVAVDTLIMTRLNE